MNKKTKRPNLTKENFKKWLESKKPLSIVGYTGTCDDCPLENFHVSEGTTMRGDEVFTSWMYNFIITIDTGRKVKSRVTAKRALKVLSELSNLY